MSEQQAKNSQVRYVDVAQEDVGQRIDNYLLKILKGVPKSVIYRILRKGEVRVNKGRVKAVYRLQADDRIRIPPVRVAAQKETPTPGLHLREQLESAVLFEDKRLIVLNKPSGIAVHGGSGLSFGIIEALRAIRPDDHYLELVHRLDRETSGCLLIAKRRSTLRSLHELIRDNAIDKRYLALVDGRWRQKSVDVNRPLKKNTLQGGERVVRVDSEGKPALTRFRCLEAFADTSLVEARIFTGRTHQIRVHSAYLKSPILGDEKYGDRTRNAEFRDLGLKRLFLHASSLRFTLAEEDQEIRVTAPLEQGLQALLDGLRDESI